MFAPLGPVIRSQDGRSSGSSLLRIRMSEFAFIASETTTRSSVISTSASRLGCRWSVHNGHVILHFIEFKQVVYSRLITVKGLLRGHSPPPSQFLELPSPPWPRCAYTSCMHHSVSASPHVIGPGRLCTSRPRYDDTMSHSQYILATHESPCRSFSSALVLWVGSFFLVLLRSFPHCSRAL
jgi:hypothetical protein